MKKCNVFLVGAGPGDKSLLTVKALNLIKRADVIIYDKLVDKDILKDVKENCEMIYVGKDAYKHTMKQEDINDLIYQKSKESMVVRLKGGDPYVFGRGGEEALYLVDKGVSFEVVPGISSSIGGLTYAGIPITHRGLSQSFHVITGNARNNQETDTDWKSLAKIEGTLVFLMGIGNIEKIQDNLIANGKSPDEKVAFISMATRYNQKTYTCKLKEAKNCVNLNNIKAPSLIVIGEVVDLHDKLNFFESRELYGKTVLVTRTRSKNSEYRQILEEYGARVFEVPTIKVAKKKESEEILIKYLKNKIYDYIAFTSHNSVKYFFEILLDKKFDFRELRGIKIGSIGPATEKELNKYGIFSDVMPKNFTGKDLAFDIHKEIEENKIRDCKILYPCSEISTDNFTSVFDCSVQIDRIEVYTNSVNTNSRDYLIDVLENENVDYISFTSSSTFTNLYEMLGKENESYLNNIKKVSIGDITSNTIKKAGFEIELQAQKASIESMVEKIIEDAKKDR
ncbi:uroporphyrinogen-III C-methyltransferase [Peptostreptococcus equinus]|uniref:uroporphyrinogen-III C-methyltransferase n=1 Tax=Peptostreptococcus equinus TaxID=3003601 RepID=A0ABY7JP23_9FIRM|nr:uroporphyrinogen-III C-methyltransferase [Peptostreptococcus sp. CBA3647]WAW15114.1 uroporphyrinogen-III C-methyltransferase [Peptostreptococcus sp. CBA3647]